MAAVILGSALVVLLVIEYAYKAFKAYYCFHVKGKHVLVTGGSAGLGLEVARYYGKCGARVSIIARNVATLKKAKANLEATEGMVHGVCTVSADVTKFKEMEAAVNTAVEVHGSVDHLICNAGLSLPGYFIDQSMEVFEKVMNVNYFGAVHAVKAALPSMKDSGGKIVFVSSACGYIGFTGYAQYSPTKYALRGLADSLRNELKLYNIDVAIFYPASIDTPGFENEEKTKPKECREIEGSATLVSAQDAASAMMYGVRRGTYAITNDIGVWFLRIVGNGMAPRSYILLEMLLSPITVLIQIVYNVYMDTVVVRSRAQRLKTK